MAAEAREDAPEAAGAAESEGPAFEPKPRTGQVTDEPDADGGPAALINWLRCRRTATLILADGSEFKGFSFGHPQSTTGEVVFNTGMVGYPESLSDPSYAGQILIITFPLVGNYGVPAKTLDRYGLPEHFESDKIHARAVVISDYSFKASHFTAARSLSEWLKEQSVPGIYGVDTRALTKKIRIHGAILGKVVVQGSEASPSLAFSDPNELNLAAQVCRSAKQTWEPIDPPDRGDRKIPHIIAVDCGVKNNILRYLLNKLHVKVTVVGWDYDFTSDQFDGLLLSNGPGDPTKCDKTIEHVRTIMQKRPTLPIFGICLGNQILSLAAGASTYKMKFGNRGMNQPCIDMRTTRCYITSQNHGFAVDAKTLPADWMQFMVNANDGSNEGVIHRLRPWFSVQFHPEACGGPTDTSFLFQQFVQSISDPMATVVTTIPYSLPTIHKKVLLLGSGGLTIGQAGEFDYSGSQALKALRECHVYSVVVNPNIATVQTSWGLADRVYFLPVTPEFVTQVIKRERPDGILCTFGGQTALNCAVKLEEQGVFTKYNVRVLGTPIAAIIKTEDRDLFAKAVAECGEKIAESECCDNLDDAVAAANRIGYPVLVRAAFALGGMGSGFANGDEDLKRLVRTALASSPQVIIDRSMRGWKELEYEVVRDANDNCITVCNMENFDPCGIHTGDSIVIAPSMTLTNYEYYQLRECALKIIRHLGVVGECNIQYAVDPKSHEYRIIEVNARLSRSSALASKATGYPLAYVAAKLALGQDLVSLRNSVTLSTTACFEPSLDYCVAKVPRWDLRKFTTVDQSIGSCMKSVGEVMAIGRTFEEVIQKALRMVDETCQGFEAQRFDLELGHRNVPAGEAEADAEYVRQELAKPSPQRIWAIAKAFKLGMNVDDVNEISNIDRWFLHKLYHIHEVGEALETLDYKDLGDNLELLREAKRAGFADIQIAAHLRARDAFSPARLPLELQLDAAAKQYSGGAVKDVHIRTLRKRVGLVPAVKQIDTLAAEFPAETNYLYLTYSGEEHDIDFRPNHGSRSNSYSNLQDLENDEKKKLRSLPVLPDPMTLDTSVMPPLVAGPLSLADVGPRGLAPSKEAPGGSRIIVLGCGPYRIGSSVEFDWCCVSSVKALRALGHDAVVINCNPETVSTDFDVSDRLYFEELSTETVLEVASLERPGGMIISVGGQTPNNLAMELHRNGCNILGTSVEAIDTCENRFKFSKLCDSLRIDQPEWSEFTTVEEAHGFIKLASYPVLVRPSYVLSGAAMRVVNSDSELTRLLKTAAVVSRDYPVVISKYIQGAKEVELDAVAQNGELLNYAIAEHVENAGVHSGDATLLLPAQKLFVETHRRVKMIGQKICRALKISGPFNIQFICKENEVKVIECNMRASRSMPFISKTFNVNFIDLATRVMLGLPVRPVTIQPIDMDYITCKVPTFSFGRLLNSDPRLGVEMQSTGEVACFGVNQYEAFLKAMCSCGFKLPTKNILLCIGPSAQKIEFSHHVGMLREMGFQIYATKNTYEMLRQRGYEQAILVYKPLVKREPNVITMLRQGQLDLVINVPDSMDSQGLTDGFQLRRAAIDSNVPLIVDIKTAILTTMALYRKFVRERDGKAFWSYSSWQEYTEHSDIPAAAS